MIAASRNMVVRNIIHEYDCLCENTCTVKATKVVMSVSILILAQARGKDDQAMLPVHKRPVRQRPGLV